MTIAGQFRKAAEHDREDRRGNQRLENHPRDTESSLLVAKLYVPAGQNQQQVPVCPQLAEIDRRPSACRLDYYSWSADSCWLVVSGRSCSGRHAFRLRRMVRAIGRQGCVRSPTAARFSSENSANSSVCASLFDAILSPMNAKMIPST